MDEPSTAQAFKEAERAAAAFGVTPQYLDVLNLKDVETAFQTARKGRSDAVLALASRVLVAHRARVAELTVRNRLPTIHSQREHVLSGGLMSYGVSYADLYRRAAAYVHKILKGAKPGDLPIEQPTKFELVINLKAAKALGLTIPPAVLARADEVIQ
jgi:putative ABC transport system substrate-binding protein